MAPLDDFLLQCSRAIDARAGALPADDVRREGAAAFAAALPAAPTGAADSSTVPVCAHLVDLASDDPVLAPVLAAYDPAVSELPWVASSRMTDGGTEAALAPLNEVRDFGELQVGLLALRPGGRYPLHSHPPQELYLPIAGDGEWRFGGSTEFRHLESGELVYNHPNDVHSIIAGDTPLLALYVLWP